MSHPKPLVILVYLAVICCTIPCCAEESTWDTHIDAGKTAYKQGAYGDAATSLSLAVKEAESFGSEDPRLATSTNWLAILYQAQGKYSDAEPLLQRGLAIREKAFGPNHPDVAESLNNLAENYRAQFKFKEGEPLHRRSLAIRQKACGQKHPDVAQSLNGLAEIYRETEKEKEAEPLYKRALTIRERAFGPKHPDVAKSLNDLAVLYSQRGDFAEAEPLLHRALAIDEAALGPNHPTVARIVSNMAKLHRLQGKYAEAEPLCKRALSIDESVFGPEHPNVATDLNSLAEGYRLWDRNVEAEPLYTRALSILESKVSLDHPDLAMVRRNYAFLLRKTGREAEGDKMARLVHNPQAANPIVVGVATYERGSQPHTRPSVHVSPLVPYCEKVRGQLLENWQSDPALDNSVVVKFCVDPDGIIHDIEFPNKEATLANEAARRKLLGKHKFDPPPADSGSPVRLTASLSNKLDAITVKLVEVDFGPYMAEIQRQIKHHWFPPRLRHSKRAVATFKIWRDGHVSAVRLTTSSGVEIVDAAAVAAIKNAAPFQPLPAGSPDDVDIQFTFDYNVFLPPGGMIPTPR